MHSGLQFGGDPMNSGKQEQDGVSPFTWHCELGPQGDGTHGFPTGSGSATKINTKINLRKTFFYYKIKYYNSLCFWSIAFVLTYTRHDNVKMDLQSCLVDSYI